MGSDKILVVEENEHRRSRLSRFLFPLFTQKLETSSSFTEAFNFLLHKSNISLVIASLASLNSYGINILHGLKRINPRIGIIALSKVHEPELAVSLLEQGIIDYIADPDNLAEIYSAIKSELNKIDLIREKESFLRSLKRLSYERSSRVKRAIEIEYIHTTTLENLMTALDLRDVETQGHSRTVAKYSQVLAEVLGIKKKTILDNIKKGALLHDIGKIAIPDSILKKPGRLSEEEWEKIRLHPSLGFGLIKEIKLLKESANIILYHHERFDGYGYPKGLKKEDIPLEARIFALADALDAITSHRPYRRERSFEAAKEEITKNAGTQFDPKVVDVFCSLRLENWKKIKFETTKLLPSLEELEKI